MINLQSVPKLPENRPSSEALLALGSLMVVYLFVYFRCTVSVRSNGPELWQCGTRLPVLQSH